MQIIMEPGHRHRAHWTVGISEGLKHKLIIDYSMTLVAQCPELIVSQIGPCNPNLQGLSNANGGIRQKENRRPHEVWVFSSTQTKLICTNHVCYLFIISKLYI